MSEMIVDCWFHIYRIKVERDVLIRELKQKIKRNEELLSLLDKKFPKTQEELKLWSFHHERIRKNLEDLKKFLDFIENKKKDRFFYNRLSKIVLCV